MKKIEFFKHNEIGFGIIFLFGLWWYEIEFDFCRYTFSVNSRR